MNQCLVCRCEEITVDEVRDAIAAGARTVNDVKRQTRAGMGVCQGIFCVSEIARILHAETGTPLAEIAPLTARPPVRLIPLHRLAGGKE
jgi:NAD(P)H-nitrite reductase large subunit